MKPTLLSFFLFSLLTCCAQQERLVSTVQYFNNAGQSADHDSTVYIYSGLRNIDSSWGIIQDADTTYHWSRNNATTSYVLTNRNRLQRTTADRRSISFLDSYDSSTHTFRVASWDTFAFTPAGAPLRRQHYVYNATLQADVISSDDTLLYAPSGYDKTEVGYQYHTVNGIWQKDTFMLSFHHYDASGRFLSDSSISFSGFYSSTIVNQMSYDALGQMDTQHIMFSTSYNNVVTPVSWTMYVGSYAPSHLLDHSLNYSKNFSSGQWYLANHDYYYYDGAGNLMEWTRQTYDSAGQWVNSDHYTYTYDSYNMLLTTDIRIWSDSAQQWVLPPGRTGYHYHYEVYGPTAVPDVVSGSELALYPVPASDMLHVAADTHTDDPATISITDLSGRQCGQWSVSGGPYTGYIPVGHLPDGIYLLSISAAGHTTQRSFTIVR